MTKEKRRLPRSHPLFSFYMAIKTKAVDIQFCQQPFPIFLLLFTFSNLIPVWHSLIYIGREFLLNRSVAISLEIFRLGRANNHTCTASNTFIMIDFLWIHLTDCSYRTFIHTEITVKTCLCGIYGKRKSSHRLSCIWI